MIKENLKVKPADKHQQSLSETPVFPLPIFMLCGGVQRLRIFEQRYIDMVANSQQTDGFVIAPSEVNSPTQVSQWGRMCKLLILIKATTIS
ncbi:hypothetical protein ACLKMH_12185 [Psychromonas sp. KJ10-10]|uniref:hypothetical protein n=1 Tax=Psychromonas sp. KJ10-10 TaxID=3391823 RepID=UPI0039B38908